MNTDELQRLAREATPGPWRMGDARDSVRAGPRQHSVLVAGAPHNPDAAYIAAASPDVILALLEERRVLRAEIREALIRLRDGDVPGATPDEASGLQYAAFWLGSMFPGIQAAALQAEPARAEEGAS